MSQPGLSSVSQLACPPEVHEDAEGWGNWLRSVTILLFDSRSPQTLWASVYLEVKRNNASCPAFLPGCREGRTGACWVCGMLDKGWPHLS